MLVHGAAQVRQAGVVGGGEDVAKDHVDNGLEKLPMIGKK
jgi:hypothetical protein